MVCTFNIIFDNEVVGRFRDKRTQYEEKDWCYAWNVYQIPMWHIRSKDVFYEVSRRKEKVQSWSKSTAYIILENSYCVKHVVAFKIYFTSPKYFYNNSVALPSVWHLCITFKVFNFNLLNNLFSAYTPYLYCMLREPPNVTGPVYKYVKYILRSYATFATC